MRWDIKDGKYRLDLWLFSGVNFGGWKKTKRVHPFGGLQGDDVEASDIKSMGVICEPGFRVIIKIAATDSSWENLPWRCIQVLEGKTASLEDGRTCVQIPDLDFYDEYDANRHDPEFEQYFEEVDTLAEGKSWTFGRIGALKGKIKSIRVEPIPGFKPSKKKKKAFKKIKGPALG